MNRFSQSDAIAAIEALSAPRLSALIEARIICPLHTDHGPEFSEPDLARLQLVCDLIEDHGLDTDALAMVMSLVDQLATMRGDMRALMQAVAAEPDEVRHRIHRVVTQTRITIRG